MGKLIVFLTATALLAIWPFKVVHAKTLTIAVIDTGVDVSVPNLCRFGHKSFVPNGEGSPLVDTNGHGSHIAGIIGANAGEGDYCIVSIKYYSDKNTAKENLASLTKALQYAININVKFINLSGGGPQSDKEEFNLIKKALKKKIKIVVAAGNEHDDLDKSCNYFPACYDTRITMVGNLQKQNTDDRQFGPASTSISPSSNYGKRVTRWEIGTDVESTLPGGKRGKMSGTSQATAVATGKLVREALDQ